MTEHAESSVECGFFGKRLSDYFGVEASTLAQIRRHGKLYLAVPRLTLANSERTVSSQLSSEPAFSILHQPADGTVIVTDLRENAKCELKGPLDLLQYYVPRRALDDFAREHDAKPVETLRWSRDRRDPCLSTISSLLLSAIEEDRTTNQLFVDQIGLSLLAHFAQTYGGLRTYDGALEGGLAPWQERRAKEIMRARLASRLTIADVAAECRLTPSHFARSFRRSAGIAPHEYLSRLRMDEAKRLLTTTKLPLADIALICGFGDQSYFTRVFSR
ncbi:AraC family transcriptional regulator, partial [Bradyrhizobium neotropicale]